MLSEKWQPRQWAGILIKLFFTHAFMLVCVLQFQILGCVSLASMIRSYNGYFTFTAHLRLFFWTVHICGISMQDILITSLFIKIFPSCPWGITCCMVSPVVGVLRVKSSWLGQRIVYRLRHMGADRGASALHFCEKNCRIQTKKKKTLWLMYCNSQMHLVLQKNRRRTCVFVACEDSQSFWNSVNEWRGGGKKKKVWRWAPRLRTRQETARCF